MSECVGVLPYMESGNGEFVFCYQILMIELYY